ncbi:type III secretion protein J [Collimonas sp. OK242]|jgi:type III secretion protein J|uniref:type III secretion system inner membrane ring lipoprotein SctJ n=1 Tax=Collimonas sp. OK242 TaxID=1798195 RepID=UPI00089AC020|nr:type III secretion inner membrane ring lipoprotein SctJ [Collimonas sp. OK242]SDY73309.1 type III secretion protein J [Collimonas sp. OK242]
MKYLFSVIDFRRWLILTCLVTSLAFLSGCKEAVYNQLSEREANNILLTLLKGGVEADKRADGEKGYSILVSESKMALAIELLKMNAEPEEPYRTMGDLFARNQLIATPAEERIRFIYGIEQGLAATLSKIDGVLVARVHIVMPDNDPLANQVKPTSASVFLKHRADMNMQVILPAVKDMVVHSVEGLTVDRVAVTLFPATATSTTPSDVPITRFFGALVAASSVSTLWMLLGLPWLLVVLLAVALFFATRLRALLWSYVKPSSSGMDSNERGERPVASAKNRFH